MGVNKEHKAIFQRLEQGIADNKDILEILKLCWTNLDYWLNVEGLVIDNKSELIREIDDLQDMILSFRDL